MLRTLLLIGLGGGLGSILRYLINVWMQKNITNGFLYATFTVNLIGSLLIGLLMGYILKTNGASDLKFLMVIGFCGGFTTFSSFAYENYTLLQSGNISSSILYTIASVVLCVLAVWLGIVLAQMLYKS